MMAQLVNCGMFVCPFTVGRGKVGGSSRSARGISMATYDEMSPAERKKLMNGLEALTGLREGPKRALPDGTRYEYDPILKRTVEITPSGERFPVTLVEGKLKRDSQKADRRKGGAS
jgi:hypothetical protein